MSIKALQEYTRFSKYARFKKDLGRRETWEEQVERVFGMHRTQIGENKLKSIQDDFDFAETMMQGKKVLGSQRALQFGGEPVLVKNPRIYNCVSSYCDRPRFFQECMFLLLCGCGTGFSVQKQHIDQLPQITMPKKGTKEFIIPDSIEGWADALGVLMSSYFVPDDNVPFPEYCGYKVEFNFDEIRPAGAPISSGSKAPGPDGLRASLMRITHLMDKSCKLYDKLRPIDAYDVVMHASDAVLSGGIRRSASLCIFSKDDTEMMKAKTGAWRRENPQRGRSNNSVILLRDETTKKEFMEIVEYVKEYGEPGFVWADDLEIMFNPCVTGDTWVMTDKGPRQAGELQEQFFYAYVNGKTYPSESNGFFATGHQPVFSIETIEGFCVEATDKHKFLTEDGWKQVGMLEEGDRILIHQHENIEWGGEGNQETGWLLGSLIGDGCMSGHSAKLDYWGESRFTMRDQAIAYIDNQDLNTYKDITGGDQISNVGKIRLGSMELGRLAEKYGITQRNKEITDEIEKLSSDFYKGFLRGYFDADGTVNCNHKKGCSVRLYSVSMNNLKRVQRMLLRLGIYSKIYVNRRPEGQYLLPDGCGSLKEYTCQSGHEIVISNDAIFTFAERIGFSEPKKQKVLHSIIEGYQRQPNKTKFVATVKTIALVGSKDVFDCNIEKVHAFDANGLYAHNCVEISMYPTLVQGLTKKSGWSVCNLSEINVKKAKTEDDFLDACRAASIIGTIQATYTKFDYLGEVSEQITRRDALLGVSMTGMADNPDIAFNPSLQRKGAKLILETNKRIAKVLGINPCARGTCVKPAGTSSCILGTASGIHPHHAKRYFRRVQANKMEVPMQYFRMHNPLAVEESVWSSNKSDVVVTFLCEVPDGAKTKNQVDAMTLLENVKLTQQNWVEKGTRYERLTHDSLRHNVSNTITIRNADEWQEAAEHIYRNRRWYAGITMLPSSGDKDYPQSPFTAVLTPTEIVREYGNGCMFASGLIVDGMRAFENNLWAACDCALDIGEIITVEELRKKIEDDCATNGVVWKKEGLSPKSPEKLLQAWLEHNIVNYDEKIDWVRRAKQFALRYFDNDIKKMTYCLKDVANWKLWCDLGREYKEVDWTQCFEDENGIVYDYSPGAACAGGQCELGELGLVIQEKTRGRKAS